MHQKEWGNSELALSIQIISSTQSISLISTRFTLICAELGVATIRNTLHYIAALLVLTYIYWITNSYIINNISFTLYPARSRVGRGNLVKDTPFPTFCRILEALHDEWQNLTSRFVSTPERRNGNIKLSKYFISSSGDRTHNQSVSQSHFVPLRHDRPQAWPRPCIIDSKLFNFHLTTRVKPQVKASF